MPRITVVVPSYNHARFLPACLASVQAQTFEDWRLLLIDDGSRDESLQIARAAALLDPRIEVRANETNLGTYGAQQRGLDESSSPLVAIMNSDDLWAPTKLARQVEALDRHPEAAFCYVRGGMIDAAGQAMKGEDVHLDWPTDEVGELLPWLLYENRVLASGVVFRRPGLRFETSCRYSGDWVTLIERAVAGPAALVPEPLTFWRQHEHNTYLASPRQMREEIRVREAIARQAADWSLPRLDPALVRRGLAKNALNLFALRVFFHDLAGARRAGFEALRYGSRAALKRTLGGFLPIERLRPHLWPRMHGAANDLPAEELRRMLREGEPLRLLPPGTHESDVGCGDSSPL